MELSEIMVQEEYDELLALGPDKRGYVLFATNALFDEEGSYDVSRGLHSIDDRTQDLIGDDAIDHQILDFLRQNYPQNFAAPFRTLDRISPETCHPYNFKMAEICKNSRGMMDRFLFADRQVAVYARAVNKRGLYEIEYGLVYPISRENFMSNFRDQYSAYSSESSRRKIRCMQPD